MSMIYLISSSLGKFSSQMHLISKMVRPCQVCGYGDPKRLLETSYLWETEFEDPYDSISEEHDFFWSELQPAVTTSCAKKLFEAGLQGSISKLTPTISGHEIRMVANLPEAPELFLIKPALTVDVSGLSRFDCCSQCGKFTHTAIQTTRLRVNVDAVGDAGWFTLRQNRGCAIFVSESGRQTLEQLSLKGLGFYKAGVLVE